MLTMKEVNGVLQEDSNNSDVISKYKTLLERNEIFEISFTQVTKNGDLIRFEDEYKIIMPVEESTINGKPYNTRNVIKARKLLNSYRVVVKHIDENKMTITVSYKLSNEQLHKRFRNRLIKDIKQIKKSGKNTINNSLIYPAKVIGVNTRKKTVIVDINESGLYGYIPQARWQVTYPSDLKSVVKIGSTINIKVLDYRFSKIEGNNKIIILCSRRELLKNPWLGIEERFSIGDIVKIKCVQLREKSWFGRIEGLEQIEIYCEYPDDSNHAPKGLQVKLNKDYEGYIYSVSEERRLLKARVFKEC